jgi:iron complex transport system substrate-binding protein
MPAGAEPFLWNPDSVEDVLDLVLSLGELLGIPDRASELVVALRERFYEAADFVTPYTSGPRVCVLESLDPPIVSGRWAAQLLERAGAEVPLNPTSPMADAGAGAGAQQAHRIAGPPRKATPSELASTTLDVLLICLPGRTLEESIQRTREWLDSNTWAASLPCVRSNAYIVLDGRLTLADPGPCLVETYRWLVGWINARPALMAEEFPCHLAASDRT